MKSPLPLFSSALLLLASLLAGCTPGHIRGAKNVSGSVSKAVNSLSATPSLSVIEPSQSRCPPRIIGSAQQGWMTGLGLPFANTYRLARWGNDGMLSFLELQPLTLGNPPGLNPDSGFQGRLGNRFIMGGTRSGGDSIKIGEWDCDTGQLLYETRLGDPRSLYGSGASLPNNGGFAGVFVANSEPQNLILLDAFYRGPQIPPPPSGTQQQPSWWYRRFQFPSNTGSMLPYQTTAVWWRGFLWFFFTRDSAGQVGLARLRVEGNGLVMDYFEPGFINNGDPAACSGEYPMITAIVDPWQDRIVLGYHSNHMYPTTANPVQNSCAGGPWAVKWALAEVNLDLSFKLLGLSDWWINRNTQTRPIVFSQPDGLHFIYACTHLETDCAEGWKIGRFDGTTFDTKQTLPYGNMLALSADEWGIFYDRIDNATKLLRMEFTPTISIKKSGSTAQVRWAPSRPGDVLEESSNGGASWRQIQGTYAPPVTLPLLPGSRWFRVRRQ